MIYLKVAALIACIVAGILFGAANQQPAVLTLFGFSTKTAPLYLVLVLTFLAGAVLAFVYNILAGSDTRARMKQTQEQIRAYEKTLKEQLPRLDALRAERAKRDEERNPAGQAPADLAEKA